MDLRISFGMLVLNGQPFVRYNLRALYPWAHQIIISEGACRTAKAIARPDGHSTDGTLEEILRFQAEEDPERKVILVSARDEGFADGFWPEKTEMCQAFAKRATGNCLWQIDSDEFYLERDMPRIVQWLEDGVGMVVLPQFSFWGGMDYINDSMALREFDLTGHGVRVFRWEHGYQYTEHRPPTVVDASGADVSRHGVVNYWATRRTGIYRYHYCLVFPTQVLSKVSYYSVRLSERGRPSGDSSDIMRWHEQNYLRITNPYAMHNIGNGLSWVRRFHGDHPEQVVRMMTDIRDGRIPGALRGTDDVEQLLQSLRYRAVSGALEVGCVLGSSRLGYPMYRCARGISGLAARLRPFR